MSVCIPMSDIVLKDIVDFIYVITVGRSISEDPLILFVKSHFL